ncbi:MAG TPA: adenylyltransferase/cytidyltransferase family protein [Geobacterales bacterium]|nr:adenylyltransferase/cytidyltransferase family protein [Geobacterales bacterium]
MVKKVMVTGTFEILHPGHIYLFKQASKLGKVYVVVARDENVRRFKNREPVIGEKQRLEVVQSIKYVYKAMLGNKGENIFEIIKKIKPDIILLGPDQRVDEEKLHKFLEENGIKAEVMRLKERINKDLYDTSKIIKRIRELNIKVED